MKKLINFLFLPSVLLINKCFLCESETQKITGNCGGTFSGYQYMISSPDYPSKYPENQDCIYFLRGSRLARCDQEFHLQFLDLDLRPSENCQEDFLQIGDRNIYCGTTVGLRSFKGENNILKIRFHSGKEGGGKGFRILVTTLPCVNSQGNSNKFTIRNVTPRTTSATLKPENSTKLSYEDKTDKNNKKTMFDPEAESENSNLKFEVETLNPVYRPQVTFSSENDIHLLRGGQPPFDPKPTKNCSTPKDIRKLGSSTYLYLPPSSTPSKLSQTKNFNFSIKSPSTEYSLPIFKTIPFRPGQQNLPKSAFETTPFRSNQQNLNKLTFERQQASGNFYSEPVNNNKMGVDVANDCDKNGDVDLEFNKGENKEENFPDRNFQGNFGDFPSFGNGVGYPGQIGGNRAGYPGQIGIGGIVGHPLPGIGNGINSENFPGNQAGDYPGPIGGSGVVENPLPGIGSGNYPGSSGIGPGINPIFNPEIFPGVNSGVNYPGQIGGSGVVGNPLPGIGSEIYPGINPGFNPDIGPGVNPGVVYPGQIGGSGVVGNPLPGIGSGNVPGVNPGVAYPGPVLGNGVVGNPHPGIGSGIYPGSSGIDPGLYPGQILNPNPNPIFPNFPNDVPNYPGIRTRPECCAPLFPSPRTLISSPGFPTLHPSPIPYDCGYTITRFSPSYCRLRLNLKFFNLGSEDPYCINGHLEVDNRRICGCRTGQSLVFPFGNYPAKTINVRYSGFPNPKFSGFLIEVVQEVCGDYYPLIRNRKDLSAVNGSSSSLEEKVESIVSSKSIRSSEGSHARRKREGYSYPKPTGHAILDVHSGGGRSEALFWNSCQARVFLDWILAAKEAFIRGARCPGSGSSGINQVIPILGGSGRFPGNCEEIAALEGVISSPFYPSFYTNNIRKSYRFYKSRGYCRLELSVLDFDLEPSLGCSKDYLLFSGQNKRYCGNSLTGTTTVFDISRSNVAEIYFVTDLSGRGRGFTAGFVQTPC